MDGKRLDLDAPLLSFRRITVLAAGEEVSPLLPSRCSSDLNFGQVGIAGAVPFCWEKTPGQPKDSSSSFAIAAVETNPAAPKLPPGRCLRENGVNWLRGSLLRPESEAAVGTRTPLSCSSSVRSEKEKVEDEEESYSTVCVGEDDAFSYARDAFSCAESFSMRCSVSVGDGAKDSLLRRSTKDSEAKDFMMGRFLHASKTMAQDSPQRTWRKPARARVDEGENSSSKIIGRKRLPVDYQNKISRSQLHGTKQEEEEEEEEKGDDDDDYGIYAGSGFFSSEGCGLIQRFCLKSSIGSLNRDPGLKAQGKTQLRACSRASPRINVLQNASLGQTEDEDSWEDVYRYKLSRGYFQCMGDESKLMTESNQFTSWSDSQMLDGSSFLNSTCGALTPDKQEDLKRESGSWKTGSSGLCEKVNGNHLEATYCHDRLQWSGSTSPATERPLNQNSLSFPETPDCNLVLANVPSHTKTRIKYFGNSSAVKDEFRQIDESVVTEISEGYELQSRSSKIAEPGFSSCGERLNGVEIYDNQFDNNENNDDILTLKVDLQEKNENSLALCLHPLPLPISPSESWLRRTLPSVSSKISHQQSFMGIQLHSKKQTSWASAGGRKSIVTYEKTSNLHPRKARFVEVAKGTCGIVDHDV